MSRNTTLSASLVLDWQQARTQYQEFLAYVAANQPRATLNAAAEGAGGRITTTFGGQQVVTTAPPNPAPPNAPAPVQLNPAVAVAAPNAPQVNLPAQVQVAPVQDEGAQNIDAVPNQGAMRYRAGGGGAQRLFGLRMGGLARVATIGFAVTEASHFAGAFAEYSQDEALAEGDPLKELHARKRLADSLYSTPFIGGGLRALSYVYARATGTPTLEEQGVEIERGRTRLENSIERAGNSYESQIEVAQTRRAAARAGMNPFDRQMKESEDAQKDFRDRLDEQRVRMQDRAIALKQEGRKFESEEAWKAAHQFAADEPGRVEANDELEKGKRTELTRKFRFETRQEELNTAATKDEITGFHLRSRLDEINGKFQPIVNERTGIITGFAGVNYRGADGSRDPNVSDEDYKKFKAQLDQYNVLTAGAHISETKRVRTIEGNTAALSFLAGHLPYQARLRAIKTAEDNALEGIDKPEEITRIKNYFTAQRSAANTEREDQRDMIQISLTTRADQIKALRGFMPETAEIIGQRGEALTTIKRLHKDENDDLAQQAADNAIDQLSFTRESYMREFRGTATDISNLGAGNVRQGESPADVVQAIKDAKQEIVDAIGALGSD